MGDHRHYVPVLKGKQGEFEALAVLRPTTRVRLSPLIEITPIDIDYKTQEPKSTPAKYLERLMKRCTAAHLQTDRAWIDLAWVEAVPEIVTPFFTECRTAKLQVVPVWRPESCAELHDVVRDAMETDRRGVCIRLHGDALDPQLIASVLFDIMDDLAVKPADVDLVLDFQEITRARKARDIAAGVHVLLALPMIAQWRSLIWSATAFPATLSEFGAGTVGTIERVEWTAWMELVSRAAELPRVPSFADYAVAHPGLPTFDPKKMGLSASARYTDVSSWVIWKGRTLKKHGYEQYNAIAKAIVDHPAYAGSDFSWGDRIVQRCAMGDAPGTPTLWRKIGTSHHLEFVTRALANLPALSAAA